MTNDLEELKKTKDAISEDILLFCTVCLRNLFLPSDPKKEYGEVPWYIIGMFCLFLKSTDFLNKNPNLIDVRKRIHKNFIYETEVNDIVNGNLETVKIRNEYFKVVDEKEYLLELNLPKMMIENHLGEIIPVDKNKFSIIIPRGAAKTTAIIAYSLFALYTKRLKYLAIISKSQTHSRNIIGTITNELKTNPILLTLYGDITGGSRSEVTNTSDMVITNKASGERIIQAKGITSQIRGLNIRGVRPDCILLDDVEDNDNTNTMEKQQFITEVILNKIIPSLRDVATDLIFFIGTLIGGDNSIKVLSDYDNGNEMFIPIRFKCIDVDGEPIFRKKFSKTNMDNLRKIATTHNNLRGFYLEYYSTIIQSDRNPFLECDLQILNTKKLSDYQAIAITLDPAISPKRTADFCAFSVLGLMEEGNYHLINIMYKRGMTVTEQYTKIVDWYMYYAKHINKKNIHVGIETVGYQASLKELISNECAKRGVRFEILQTDTKTKKIERIRTAFEFLLLHTPPKLYFTVLDKEMEMQIKNFPDANHDDIPDVIAMGYNLLSSRYAYKNTVNMAKKYMGKQGKEFKQLETFLRRKIHG